MQKQLSIFDTLQPLDTAIARIRPGDWVKLKKDASGAIDWSYGEVLQIESIDPTSGRARFWNDRVQEWGYLRSADMALTVPPLKVLKNQPIAPVEELPPVPDAVDSVSMPALGDTESAEIPTEFDSVSNCHCGGTLTHPVVEADTESICQPERIDSVSGPVATYRPKGSARGGEYFRYSYRAGEKMKHLHIPGGNTGNVLAQSRAAEVMELAAAGVSAVEICDRIRSWSGRITW